jgi:hypothetical protein
VATASPTKNTFPFMKTDFVVKLSVIAWMKGDSIFCQTSASCGGKMAAATFPCSSLTFGSIFPIFSEYLCETSSLSVSILLSSA